MFDLGIKYAYVYGCKLLEKNKCKFIVIPCNTAHYWFEDLQKNINIPIINMPKEVYKFTNNNFKITRDRKAHV